MEEVIKLLKVIWKLEPPDLIISITGGAKEFNINKCLLKQFEKGLMRAASLTKAWIITGGTHSGVMKHVGKAVNEYLTANGNKKEIVIIGIASWGRVQGNELLEKKREVKYEQEQLDPSKALLDENHTHFLLIDNGKNEFGEEIDFRTRFEKEVSDNFCEGVKKIPIVCIILEGGIGTFKTCLSAAKNKTPCVIIANSGRAADIMTDIYEEKILEYIF